MLHHVADRAFTPDRCKALLQEYVETQGAFRKQATEKRRLLERERAEVERRRLQLMEHLETRPDLSDALVDRLRDLTARKGELEQQVRVAARAGTTVPPHLYSPNTIARFQEHLRQTFLGDDGGVTRAYLNRLIESVAVADDEIVIEVRGAAALALMARPGKLDGASEAEPDGGPVHGDVVGWRTP